MFFVQAAIDIRSVTQNTPANNQWISSASLIGGTIAQFNCTANTDNDLVNLTFWTNVVDGTFKLNQSNLTAVTNNTAYNFSIPNPPQNNTGIIWNCQAWNGTLGTASNNSFAASNFTFYVDTILPVPDFNAGTIENRVNASIIDITSILVNLTITEANIANITFILYNSTGQARNITNYTGPTTSGIRTVNFSTNGTFSFTLNDGVYYFNATIVDNATNANYTVTRQITIDTTTPVPDFNAGTTENSPNNSFLNINTIFVNLTITEVNIANVTFVIYNNSALIRNITNYTGPTTSGIRTVNFTGLSDQIYYFNATVVDNVTRINYTVTRQITLDSTFAILNHQGASIANNTFIKTSSSNSTYVNFTVTETNPDNITFTIYNSSVFSGANLVNTTVRFLSGSAGLLDNATINFTNLPFNLPYYYNATITDKANNKNASVMRLITFDDILPLPIFNEGTVENSGNNSYLNINSIFVNITLTETNLGNLTFVLYNATSSVSTITNYSTLARTANFTGLNANRIYYYNVTVVDNATNTNYTVTRQVTLDNTLAILDHQGASEANDTYVGAGGRNWTYVNFSITETNAANITFTIYNSSTMTDANRVNTSFFSLGTTVDNTTHNFTNLKFNQVYYFNATITDKANNKNASIVRRITFDDILAILDHQNASLPNNSFVSENWTYVNFSISEVNPANITITIYNSSTTFTGANLINTTFYALSTNLSAANHTINFTNLISNLNYSYNATITDLANNKNSSVVRLVTLDNIVAILDHQGNSSENSSSSNNVVTRNWTYVNFSVTENNPANITFTIYNNSVFSGANLVNTTVRYLSGKAGLLTNTTINFSDLLPNFIYYYNATVTDLANNKNASVLRRFILDNTPPFVENPEKNQSNVGTEWVNFTVNVSDKLELSGFIFSMNISGGEVSNFTNSTYQSLTGNNTRLISNITYITGNKRNVSWLFYINDTAGNWNQTTLQSFFTSATDSGGGSSGGGGGSSGGASSTAPSTPNALHSETHSVAKITPGAASIVKIVDPETGLKEIQVTVTKEATAVKITVTKLEGKPAVVTHEINNSNVYKYFEINKTNLDDSNLQQAKLTVRVEKSFLDNNKYDKNNVVVQRYNAITGWSRLDTKLSSEADSKYTDYDVTTPGFSIFAITVDQAATASQEELDLVAEARQLLAENEYDGALEALSEAEALRSGDQYTDLANQIRDAKAASTAGEPPISVPPAKKSYVWAWIIAIIGIIGIVVLVVFLMQKQKNRKR